MKSNEAVQNITEKSKRLMTETVELKIPRDPTGVEEDVFVSVNGKSMRIKRGVPVKIPKAFAMVLDEANDQMEYAYEYAEQKVRTQKTEMQ